MTPRTNAAAQESARLDSKQRRSQRRDEGAFAALTGSSIYDR